MMPEFDLRNASGDQSRQQQKTTDKSEDTSTYFPTNTRQRFELIKKVYGKSPLRELESLRKLNSNIRQAAQDRLSP